MIRISDRRLSWPGGLRFLPVELPGPGKEQITRPLPEAQAAGPQRVVQRLERLRGPVEARVAQPAGEPIVLDARPRVDHPRADDHGVEDLAQGGEDRGVVRDRTGGIRPQRIGPTEIQAATQESLLIGHGLAEPEVAGVIPEIPDAEVLDSDDAGGIDVFIVESRMDRLGVGFAAGGSRGGPDGGAGGLEMRRRGRPGPSRVTRRPG